MARKKGHRSRGKVKCMKSAVRRTKLPRYSEMVRVALIDTKQLKGSTNKDILKYIVSKYGLSETTTVERALDVALKSGVKNGTLIKIDKSYKLLNTAEGKQGTCMSKKEIPSQKGKGKRKDKVAKASEKKKAPKSEIAKQNLPKPEKMSKGIKKELEIGKGKPNKDTKIEAESANKE